MTRLTTGLIARHTPNGPLGRSAALVDIAQDLLLAHLHEQGVFDHLIFKGGTALRKLYAGNAGRFSTDLDFALRAPTDDADTVTALLVDAIDGYEVDGFSYRVETRRGRPAVAYETPFGDAGGLTTKLDVGPTPWLEPDERGWIRLPIHDAYETPGALPVMSLAENLAEKISRLNRITPARDAYDLVWVATTSPHSAFDRALVRRLAVLKSWVDLHGLHSTNGTWTQPPGAAPFDAARWLRVRKRQEFDDDSIGVLASPPPDLEALAATLSSRYAFLADLDGDERRFAEGAAADRAAIIAAIKALPDERLRAVALW